MEKKDEGGGVEGRRDRVLFWSGVLYLKWWERVLNLW